MPSKKAASDKRAALPKLSAYSKQFLKDWERHDKSRRSEMRRLKSLMLLSIANDGPLAAEWRDHELVGEWRGYRDAHVRGDFLLLYRVESAPDRIVFERLGTHSELFG